MNIRITITKEIDINRFPRSAESLFDDNGEPKVMSNEELATVLKTEFNGGWIDALDIMEDADWKVEVVGTEKIDALAQYRDYLKSTIPIDPDEVVVSDYARGCLHTTKHVIAMLDKILKECGSTYA